MNQLLIFTFVSLLSGALSNPIVEDNPELVSSDGMMFADFCRSSDAFIKSELEAMARDKASILFKQFFQTSSDIFADVLKVQIPATQQIANQIENPDTIIEEGPEDQSKVSRLVEEARTKIQQTPGPRSLAPAIQFNSIALATAFQESLMQRYPEAKAALNGMALQSRALEFCSTAHDIRQKLANQLMEEKEKLLAKEQDPANQEYINQVELQTLNCDAAKNVARLSSCCVLAHDGFAPFMKMIGRPVSK